MTLSATVSGSFHRHMTAVCETVRTLTDAGVRVLSPSDPRIVDEIGPFLFVASDRHRSVRLVQDRHLDAIRNSDFLLLVCPDGYVGQSASLELGFAIGLEVPIFSLNLPPDLTLRQYVQQVDSIADAIQMLPARRIRRGAIPSLLVDPSEAIKGAHDHLEQVRSLLVPRSIMTGYDPFPELARQHRKIEKLIALSSASYLE